VAILISHEFRCVATQWYPIRANGPDLKIRLADILLPRACSKVAIAAAPPITWP